MGRGRRRGGPARRVLLLGGIGAVLGVAVAQQNGSGDAWWRGPVASKPRKPGELDHKGASWTAASEANWRRADRPDDYRVDRVVIHVVQGSFPVALKVFKDPKHKAAAHYVVRKDGHIAQMVRELDVAYHSGNRSWNQRSIGIEHEGFVHRKSSFTDAMYAASARLTADICRRYGIPIDRQHIVGHVEVPGADHTDPGPYWDWPRYLRLVRAARAGLDREAEAAAARTEPAG
ncbi:N-acetylmuramoyl-L-alanine amidase [Streptomyces sp. NPDC006879]|uniref:N-acetylmuramoyl-L-alanine amidase n=1 Tax=Streptomyces sp. NPDC006879 TaxID=3364767 RepID=UPI0036ACC23C